MIPHTYPTVLDTTNNTRQMVVFYLSSVSGLVRWLDYIPVKESPLASPELNSFNTNGAIYVTGLSSTTGKQAWLDYVPVYEDSSATDAWSVNALGYITTKSDLAGRALSIIQSYGNLAHVYIPGIGSISGFSTENFQDSAGTTQATVGGLVGRVNDASGSFDATETTNRPTLRQSSGLYSWQFDGTNDILKLSSIPFVMADDHLIVLGVNLNALGSVDPFVIANTLLPTGGLLKLGFSGSGQFLYAFRNDIGTLLLIQTTSEIASINTTYVMSGRKSGVNKELRVNGVPKSASANSVGDTALNVASIGARNLIVNSNFVNGFIYPVIAINGAVTDADRLILEKFVGSLSGVTI
jgi:hypothetical protein